jgi:hypothetical protein
MKACESIGLAVAFVCLWVILGVFGILFLFGAGPFLLPGIALARYRRSVRNIASSVYFVLLWWAGTACGLSEIEAAVWVVGGVLLWVVAPWPGESGRSYGLRDARAMAGG